jgi:hypothetical protein
VKDMPGLGLEPNTDALKDTLIKPR